MNEMSTPQASPRDAAGDDPVDPLALMRRMLVEQAVSLDGMFADLNDFVVETFAESPGAAQAYIRLALRAQSSCRSSLEALAPANRATRQMLDQAGK